MIRHLLLRQKNKENVAVIEHEKEILYHDLIQKALMLQMSLLQGQTGPIAIFLPDSADYMAAFWGVISLGMTEAAPLIAKRPRGMKGKEESVGTAIYGLDIAVETEWGITRKPGTIGEVIVSGSNVMRGYYNNEEETARVIKNGYLYTGDIGYLDEDGFLYICGRKKNVIIVRGFNVYPEEVEGCILNSLLVKDCYVYGQIDDLGNEYVCADIVPIHPQVQATGIKKYCGNHLAEYKQPQRIIIRESIKKNLTGKTERSKGLSS